MECDALIIGGGPAGAAAAIWLAEAGRHVILLEKTATAQHKVCGEFISIEAQNYLQQVGVNLAQAGALPITDCLLIAARQQAKIRLPFQGMSLSRHKLDELLLQRAGTAGVDVRRGETVTALTRDANGWQALLGRGQTIHAPTAFLATGKHDLRGWQRDSRDRDLIGLKMHFRLQPEAAASLTAATALLLFDGGYVGLEPIEAGLANLCLVVRKPVFAQHGKDWRSLLDALCRQLPPLARWLQAARPCWEKPLAVYGIPYGFVADNLFAHGLYRVGDQAAVIPSLFGDGMAIALYTAYRASQHYLHGTALPDKAVRRQIGLAAVLSQLCSRSWLQPHLVRLCRLCPPLPRLLVRMTRCRLPERT